jgi:hypothetical protein
MKAPIHANFLRIFELPISGVHDWKVLETTIKNENNYNYIPEKDSLVK